MKIRAKIQAPSRANRLRRVEKAEIKESPFRIVFYPFSTYTVHFRINSKRNVIQTINYHLND